MPSLFCFGLGYSATHFIAELGNKFDRIAGTVREAARAARIAQDGIGGIAIDALAFDGTAQVARIDALLAESDALLVSVPPDTDDPVLKLHADAIARGRLSSVVYLSTVGVYGDHAGAWVDEMTEPAPVSQRSRERVAAERGWAELGRAAHKPVAILRLAGIYGPGQNALVQVARGTAKRIVKPGQVFNRIHVADIAQAIDAAFAKRADGVFNVTDDAPTPPGEPIDFAADLLKVAPPPEIPFDEAAKTMSPMGLSFWGECKRARNERLKRELGVRLRYPSYREGLKALFAVGEGRGGRA